MPKTVLVVDDSIFVRQALREIFAPENDIEVCGEANDGKEAIERTQPLRPDVIVLDLSMPVMDGLGAARALKRLMPNVPLVIYSALGDRLAEQQGQPIGISDVVSKFEHVSVLIGKVRDLLYPQAA